MRPDETFVSQPVRSLQQMLRVIGEDRGQSTSVVPDGIFGQQTRGAVTQFQRQNGIPITGVADQVTFERIADAYEPAMTRVGAAQPLQLILNPNQVLSRGENHPYLYLVQAMLLALNEIYGSISPVEMTGVLDAPTEQALSDFQYLSGLPASGELDKVTWKHLALHYPLAVNLRMSQNRGKA